MTTTLVMTMCDQRRLLLEKNVLLDDAASLPGVRRGGAGAVKQSRWPSLFSLVAAVSAAAAAGSKPAGRRHAPPPPRAAADGGLSTARRQFRSELDVRAAAAAADRKQYGGAAAAAMTSPRVGVGRPSSALTRPRAVVAVDIPLDDDRHARRRPLGTSDDDSRAAAVSRTDVDTGLRRFYCYLFVCFRQLGPYTVQ